MGTTVQNLHVRAGDGADAVAHVAAALTESAFVSPPQGGWVSVYPEHEALGKPGLAVRLSGELGGACVDFSCMDSDVAVASLSLDGELVDQLVVAQSGMLAEMFGPAVVADRLAGIESSLEVSAGIDQWTAVLGGDTDDIVAAANALPDTPFAEEMAGAILGRFGIDAGRLVTAFRFIERGDAGDDVASFTRVG